jgi:hypothetical protein
MHFLRVASLTAGPALHHDRIRGRHSFSNTEDATCCFSFGSFDFARQNRSSFSNTLFAMIEWHQIAGVGPLNWRPATVSDHAGNDQAKLRQPIGLDLGRLSVFSLKGFDRD